MLIVLNSLFSPLAAVRTDEWRPFRLGYHRVTLPPSANRNRKTQWPPWFADLRRRTSFPRALLASCRCRRNCRRRRPVG